MLWSAGLRPAVRAAELLPVEPLAELPLAAVPPAGAATAPLKAEPAAAFLCSAGGCATGADVVGGEDVLLLPPHAVMSRQPAIRMATPNAQRRTRTVRVMHVGRSRGSGGSGPPDNVSGTNLGPAIIGAVTYPKRQLRRQPVGVEFDCTAAAAIHKAV